MPVRFDPLLNKVRIKDIIPQLDADPSSPKQQEAWVLRTYTPGEGAGEAIGLLLALTTAGAGSTETYQLSYRTKEDTTVRVSLS